MASTGCREMMEVQSHAQQLLAAIFEITITEEASVSILDSYPELVWLANCLRRCPLPPGWTATDAGNGMLKYIDMETRATSEASPLLDRFAELGRLMLHWRQNPTAAQDVADALTLKQEKDLEEASRARKVWQGPHLDPETQVEFWHCPATGRSTWGDPGMASEFLARIAERLKKALPVGEKAKESESSEAESATTSAGASAGSSGELSDGSARAPTPAVKPSAEATPPRAPRPSSRSRGRKTSFHEEITKDAPHREQPLHVSFQAASPSRRPPTGEARTPKTPADARTPTPFENQVRQESPRPAGPAASPAGPSGPANEFMSTSDRIDGVRKMMAEIAGVGLGAQRPADGPSGPSGRRHRPPSAHRSRAATPAPPRASVKEEESEGDDPAPMGQEHPEIRSARGMSGRDSSADRRVQPGGSTDLGDTATDLYKRKRRPESTERLNPLASTPRAPLQTEGLNPLASTPRGPPQAEVLADMQATLGAGVEPPKAHVMQRTLPPKPDVLEASPAAKGSPAPPRPESRAGRPQSRVGRPESRSGRPKTRRGASAEHSVIAEEQATAPKAGKDLGGSGSSSLGATGDVMLATGVATMGGSRADLALMGATGAGFGGTRGPGATLAGTGLAGRLPGMTLGGTNNCIRQMLEGAVSDAMAAPLDNDDEGFIEMDEADVSMEGMMVMRPPSPSLMDISRHPDSPVASRTVALCDGSPRADSPSILILEDDVPMWTLHKPLPKRPQTPPRSARGLSPPRSARVHKEKPVLLGVPEPLSARARCKPGDAPLSARGKERRGHSRPAGVAIRRLGGA